MQIKGSFELHYFSFLLCNIATNEAFPICSEAVCSIVLLTSEQQDSKLSTREILKNVSPSYQASANYHVYSGTLLDPIFESVLSPTPQRNTGWFQKFKLAAKNSLALDPYDTSAPECSLKKLCDAGWREYCLVGLLVDSRICTWHNSLNCCEACVKKFRFCPKQLFCWSDKPESLIASLSYSGATCPLLRQGRMHQP